VRVNEELTKIVFLEKITSEFTKTVGELMGITWLFALDAKFNFVD